MMKNFIFLLSLVASMLTSFPSSAQQDYSQDTLAFSEAELAQMLAPIALYPDSLLTHILIASTYPLEIVEAHRWLKKNENLSPDQAANLVQDFDWDASVKALVPFERILSRLSEDLRWTQQLGDAFLQDESRLLASIQALRKQAKRAGNLAKMENMDVSYEDSNIIIESREKEVVYVPYYDTRMVYGTWHWSSYPPVFWQPYHSVYVSHYSPFYWHSGIHISFNYFFSAFHWHNRHVVVVNSNRSHHRYYHQRPRRLIAEGGYAKRWQHQPKHRKGVAYRTKHISQKYHSNRTQVNKTNKPLPKAQRSTAQSDKHKKNSSLYHVKQGQPVNKHVTSKREVNKREVNKSQVSKRQTHHMNHSRETSKQQLPRANKKALKAIKESRSMPRVDKEKVKVRANKQHEQYKRGSVKKQQGNSKRPSSHQKASVKSHHFTADKHAIRNR